MINGEAKKRIIREMLDDLEDERGALLDIEDRDEIGEGLWVYLDAMERYFVQKARKL